MMLSKFKFALIAALALLGIAFGAAPAAAHGCRHYGCGFAARSIHRSWHAPESYYRAYAFADFALPYYDPAYRGGLYGPRSYGGFYGPRYYGGDTALLGSRYYGGRWWVH